MKCIIGDAVIVEKAGTFSKKILKIASFSKNTLNIIEKPITIIYIQGKESFHIG